MEFRENIRAFFLNARGKETVGNNGMSVLNVTCDQAIFHSLLFERVCVKWGSSDCIAKPCYCNTHFSSPLTLRYIQVPLYINKSVTKTGATEMEAALSLQFRIYIFLPIFRKARPFLTFFSGVSEILAKKSITYCKISLTSFRWHTYYSWLDPLLGSGGYSFNVGPESSLLIMVKW